MTSSEYKIPIKTEKAQRTFTFSGLFPITAKPSRQSRLHSRRVLCNIVVVDPRGIEPLTSRLRTWRSPSWANGPNRLLAYYSTFFRFVKKIFVDYILFLSYNAFAAFDKAALVGEPAVPCNLQSATAGMNSQLRICHVSSDPGKQRWRIGLTQREPVNHVRRGTEQH